MLIGMFFLIVVSANALAQCSYDQATMPPGGPTIVKDLDAAREICTKYRESSYSLIANQIKYVTVSNQSVLNITITPILQRTIAANGAFGKQFMLDLHRMFKGAVKVDGVKRINLYVEGSEFK